MKKSDLYRICWNVWLAALLLGCVVLNGKWLLIVIGLMASGYFLLMELEGEREKEANKCE